MPTDHWSNPPATPAELAALRDTVQADRPAFDPVLYGDGWSDPRWWTVALRDRPDDVLQHTFTFFAYRFHAGPDIQWDTRLDRWDKEFNWWMNRFFFLEVLHEETERTGDRKYVRKGFELVLDWIDKNPAAGAADSWAAWRSLEVGLRLSTWVPFLARHGAERAVLSDEDWNRILRSLAEQVDYLVRVSGPNRGNWGLMEMAGVGMVALAFPELAGAERWLAFAWDTQSKDAGLQINPDGSQVEMSPVYESTVLLSFLKTAHLARLVGRPVPDAVVGAIGKTAGYLARLRHPDATLPAHNDGDAFNIDAILLAALHEFALDDAEALWLVTDGREGAAPPRSSWFFPYSGVAVLRDGFGPATMYLHLDAGPFGVAHQHEDALSVEFWYDGRPFLAEPGRYHYVESPTRAYLLSSRAHSTISVDGGGQRAVAFRERWRATEPLDARAQLDGPVRSVAGVYDLGYSATGAEDIVHHRRAVLLDGSCALLIDDVSGSGTHTIESVLAFAPLSLTVDADGALATSDGAAVRIRWAGPVLLASNICKGGDDPVCGWYSSVYGHIEPAPRLALACTVELPCTLAVLLAPVRDAAAPTSLKLESLPGGGARITVEHDGRRLDPLTHRLAGSR